MQRIGGDFQAPWDWEVIVRPSFGPGSRGPRLRMQCLQGRILRDAMH